MSKDDTASGLLSKMVKFIRSPATNWGGLDSAGTERDDAVSKQLLREMIERKRRNDFVRKREFDMLRKLRKRETLGGVGQDPSARPSFFQSSMPSTPDGRASTLKKIDEIEAQMSMQWWKSKGDKVGDDSGRSPPPPLSNGKGGTVHSPLLDNALPSAYKATEPARLQPAPAPRSAPALADQKPTVPDALPTLPSVLRAEPSLQSPLSSMLGGLSGVGGGYDGSTSGFSPSKLTALDVAEVVAHDAELEEAAIRFANGDDAGAEAVLQEILGPGGVRAEHPESWLTLFDLYRATDQQEKFENAAIGFAERFGRSAPQWFSMPSMVKVLSQPQPHQQQAGGKAGNGPAVDWICPSALGIQTVAALKAAVAKAPMPWRLDWSNLKTIEATALEPLIKVFGAWSAQPVQLRFIGDASLKKVLQNATPSGDREVNQNWWQLRMQALRVTHQPDDFELAALDFCVTYEVSPPAWESARCEYKPMAAVGSAASGQAIIGEVYRDSIHSGLSAMEGDTQMDGLSSQMSNVLAVELSGQIQGDAISVLDKLEAKLTGADMMLISCAQLIRVDFSAAGTLLNWVTAREEEKRLVQFSDVNRLVAAFFSVIGITEHARVVIRVD